MGRGSHNSRDNIRLARQFVAGTTEEEFPAERRSFCAVARWLEIISEAARRLPNAVCNGHAELPRRAIIEAGNVYQHDYDNVAEDIMWRTVQPGLAPLLSAAESDLARLTN